MRIFDPHIHMYSRTTDDYYNMALVGVRAILEPSFWLGQPRTAVGAYVHYFDTITKFEPTRAAEYGIQHFCAIGMNPKEANDEALAMEVIGILDPYINHPNCVAIGEVGFDRITKAEEKVILAQLEIAKNKRLPVIVHTPHVDKLSGTERTIALVKDSGIPEHLVIIDHNTEETIPLTRKKTECWAGHTVYTRTKLTPDRAANILEEFGTERMIINSSADWGVSDPLNVAKTAFELRKRGWKDARIQGVIWDNPVQFFSQSGKLHLADA